MKKYKTSFSNEELHNALHLNEAKAEEIIKDVDKWDALKTKLVDFIKKAEKIPILGGIIDDVQCMVCVVDSYVTKEYKEIPVSSIISIVAALIYILSPIDLIPDVIPFVGYLDDVAIIYFVMNFGIGKDLDNYRKWNENNRQIALAEFRTALSLEIKEFIGDEYVTAIVVGKNDNLQLILSASEEVDEWSEYHIKEIIIPTELLDSYNISQESEILQFMNEVIELEQITWVNGAERMAYLEVDFSDKWDEYIISEGR